jgi:hypothetical protein
MMTCASILIKISTLGKQIGISIAYPKLPKIQNGFLSFLQINKETLHPQLSTINLIKSLHGFIMI